MPNIATEKQLQSLSESELLEFPSIKKLFSKVSEFTISALPEGIVEPNEMYMWSVKVVARGNNKWAVTNERQNLDSDGKWEYENLPSSRTKKFLRNFRHDLPTALMLAEDAAKKISINGLDIEGITKFEAAKRILESYVEKNNKMSRREKSIKLYEIMETLNPDEKLTKYIDRSKEWLSKNKDSN